MESRSDSVLKKIPLSAVVMVRNEERNIRACLESLKGWVGEIVVVDDFSTDRTLDIVREYTDRIFQKKWEMEGVSRNFAYSKASHDYVLSIDADERVTPELRDELIELFRNRLEFNGYNVKHRNFIGNYWIRHGEWYPNAKLKIFRKDKFRYEETEYHPRAFMEGKTVTLKNDVLHYNFADFSNAFAKLNRMTDFEARKWIRDGRKMNLGILFQKMFSRFLKFYLGKKGYKDGFIGFAMALYSGMYQYFTYCKYWEMKSATQQDIRKKR